MILRFSPTSRGSTATSLKSVVRAGFSRLVTQNQSRIARTMDSRMRPRRSSRLKLWKNSRTTTVKGRRGARIREVEDPAPSTPVSGNRASTSSIAASDVAGSGGALASTWAALSQPLKVSGVSGPPGAGRVFIVHYYSPLRAVRLIGRAVLGTRLQ